MYDVIGLLKFGDLSRYKLANVVYAICENGKMYIIKSRYQTDFPVGPEVPSAPIRVIAVTDDAVQELTVRHR